MVSEAMPEKTMELAPERSPYRFRGDEVFHVKLGTYIARVYAKWLDKDGNVPFRVLQFRSSVALIRLEMLKGNLLRVERATPPALTKEPIPELSAETENDPIPAAEFQEQVTEKPAAPPPIPVAPLKRPHRK